LGALLPVHGLQNLDNELWSGCPGHPCARPRPPSPPHHPHSQSPRGPGPSGSGPFSRFGPYPL